MRSTAGSPSAATRGGVLGVLQCLLSTVRIIRVHTVVVFESNGWCSTVFQGLSTVACFRAFQGVFGTGGIRSCCNGMHLVKRRSP